MRDWRRLSEAQWKRLGEGFERAEGIGGFHDGAGGGFGRAAFVSPRGKSLFFAAPLVAVVAFLAALNAEERPTRGLQQDIALAIESEREESGMRSTTSIGLAAAAAVIGGARAQYADFARTTDTVRLTHEVPPTSAMTIEARVWIELPCTTFHFEHALWREQKNSFEDKTVQLCSSGVVMYMSGATPVINWNGSVPTGQWVHVACQQANGRGRIWIDGVLKHDVATSRNVIPGADGSSNSIGAGLHNNSYVVPGAQCKIDWLRVSTCARYSGATFAPPDECALIPADNCTALLFTFDEPASSGTLANRGFLPGTATIGAAWIAGATAPSLGGMSVDENGNGIPDECETLPCEADLDDSGAVDGVDLAIILTNWGAPSPKYPAADANGDGEVNGADLAIVLSGWGACP